MVTTIDDYVATASSGSGSKRHIFFGNALEISVLMPFITTEAHLAGNREIQIEFLESVLVLLRWNVLHYLYLFTSLCKKV